MTDTVPKPPAACPVCLDNPAQWRGPKYVPPEGYEDYWIDERLEWTCLRCDFGYREVTPRIQRQLAERAALKASRRTLRRWLYDLYRWIVDGKPMDFDRTMDRATKAVEAMRDKVNQPSE